MKRTEQEIRDQIDKASVDESIFYGMTYEEGIKAALEWVLGDIDAKPMDE
jgi:hypothetical protein